MNPNHQGDYLEITLINGLRKLLGNNFVDYPRKKIMYHDFSDSPKHELHGKGFSLLRLPIMDIDRNSVLTDNYDVILYGDGHLIGEKVYVPEYDKLANNNVWIIDGNDLYGEAINKKIYKKENIISNQFRKCFKRELVFEEKTVFPTGYGIPEEIIMPIDLNIKKKLLQKTYPKYANFEKPTDLGGARNHHIFEDENEYYRDLSESWFGITSIKGGWDSLRHYEIMASGTLLLFRDYKQKPPKCSPQDIPCLSYSSKNELDYIINNLIVDNKPTDTYINMLNQQRNWLLENGTTVARAKKLLQILKENKELNF